MPTAVVVEQMVVDGLDLELPELPWARRRGVGTCFRRLLLRGVQVEVLPEVEVEGLQGELPPLALEHVDPAPSLKPGPSRISPPDDPEHC